MRCKLILLPNLLAVALACGAAAAEEPLARVAPDAAAAPLPPQAERASARATMRTFLEAFYADDGPQVERAAGCLDLTGLPPEIRGVKGRELVVQLKDVIDRTRYVVFEELPDDPGAPAYVFLRQAAGEVVLERQADGQWRFTASTVASLDTLHRVTAEHKIVEGVEEAPRAATPATWLRSLFPETLRREVLLLEGWQWIGILLLVLASMIMDRIVRRMLKAAVDRFLRRRLVAVDAEVIAAALRPVGVLIMVLVWGVGMAWLGLRVAVLTAYMEGLRLVVIVVVVITAYRLANVLAAVMSQRAARTEGRFDDLLVPLVRKSLKVFIVAAGLVLVAQNLGTNVTGLVAGLGLGGLAFALAAKDTLSNLFGSLTVLLDRPFQVGDWIVVGDVEGTVEELGFRSTRIRTFYDSLITLPNSTLINASVDNLGQRSYRRWSTRLGIAYGTPPERIDAFCEGLRELVRRHPYTRKDYFHVYLNEFGGSALEVLVYVFFNTPDWATELRERHRLGVDIIRLASDLGVELAFPTQTLYVRQEDWKAAASAGEDYPQAAQALSSEARSRAGKLADSALGGEVPEPVKFDHGSAREEPENAD